MEAHLLDQHGTVAVEVELAVGAVGGPAGAGEELPEHVVGAGQPGHGAGEPVRGEGVGTGLDQPRAMALSLLTPFYLKVGFSKTVIGTVAKGVGVPATLAGLMLGGVAIAFSLPPVVLAEA